MPRKELFTFARYSIGLLRLPARLVRALRGKHLPRKPETSRTFSEADKKSPRRKTFFCGEGISIQTLLFGQRRDKRHVTNNYALIENFIGEDPILLKYSTTITQHLRSPRWEYNVFQTENNMPKQATNCGKRMEDSRTQKGNLWYTGGDHPSPARETPPRKPEIALPRQGSSGALCKAEAGRPDKITDETAAIPPLSASAPAIRVSVPA